MPIQVGAAKINIDPTREMLPFPNAGGDYTGIFSSCYVRACVIDNGKTEAVILGFDLVSSPAGSVLRPLIEKETGIPADRIFSSAIHNHTGCGIFMPTSEEDVQKGKAYEQLVLNGAVEAVKRAKMAKRPAKYGYGIGKSYINSNRDMELENGMFTQASNPELYCDHSIYLLKFVDWEDDTLICAIANYGMHATLGFLETDADGQVKVSGNIPGVAEEYAENRYGNGAVVIWTSAAAGDQNPALYCMRDYEQDGFPTMARMLPGMQYQLITLVGKQHGVDICKTINSINHYKEQMPIHFAETILMLPGQRPPEGADMRRVNDLSNCIVRFAEGETFPEMEDGDQVPMPLQQAVFGDIAFIGIPGEPYSLLGKACVDVSPYKNTILITHNDDFHGYIIDKRSVGHKCFEAFGPIKPGASDDIIVEGVRRQFDKMMGEM